MSSIIEYGVSESLQAEFALLRETPSVHGIKFRPATIDKLAQYITCRNYGKACLELSYLLWAVGNSKKQQGGVLHFFWIDEHISPSRFRSAFSHDANYRDDLPKACSMALSEQGLALSIERKEFVISATRVELLAALLELLVSNLPGVLDSVDEQLLGAGNTAIQAWASNMQKRLYAFLKDHLPTANVQQKFRYVDEWASDAFDDERILTFWQQSKAQEGYVKYTTAVNDCCEYMQAKEMVSKAYEAKFAQSLEDWQQADSLLDDELFLPTFNEAMWGDAQTAMQALTQAPKYLSKSQCQTVESLFYFPEVHQELPLTMARYSIFGRWQAKLIQASRADQKQLSTLLAEGPEQDYTAHLAQWQSIKKSLLNAMMCSSAVLYKLQDVRCLTILLQCLQQLSPSQAHTLQQSLAQEFKLAQSQLNFELPTFARLQSCLLSNRALNQAFELCQKALNKNNKAGFVAPFAAGISDEHVQAAQAAMDLVKNIDKYANIWRHWQQHDKPSEQIYRADLFIFQDELTQRHRGLHE